MASIMCRKGETFPNSHRHASVQEVKVCQGVIPAPRRDVAPYIHTPQPNPAAGFRPASDDRVRSILDAPSTRDANGNNIWEHVDKLRRAIRPHVTHRHNGRRIGFFAVELRGILRFFKVTVGANDRVFIDVQASDTYYDIRRPATIAEILSGILVNPEAARQRYAAELGQCYACGRTLTDETSRQLGIGPVCRGA